MRIIEKEYSGVLPTCTFFDKYFTGFSVAILDIETTGLNPKTDKLILGGLLSFSNGIQCLQQFFSESPKEEKDVLSSYLSAIRKYDVVVTYNGKNFDMAFLKERCHQLGVDYDANLPHNFDLYIALRGYSQLSKVLPNLKQKTVENYLGLWSKRKDEISGKESIDLYYSYCATRHENILEKILLHNHDDLLQLSKLIPILSKVDMHKAMYNMGFPVGPLSTSSLKIEKTAFRVLGNQRKLSKNYLAYPEGNNKYYCCFDGNSNEFEIAFPIIRNNRFVLIDLKGLWVSSFDGTYTEFDVKKLSNYPGVEEDFLILEKDGSINYLTVNIFIDEFLKILLR